jgi:hypothetical protein
VELNSDKPGVVLDLDDFHTLTLGVFAHKSEAGRLDLFNHAWVDLISVSVALQNLGCRSVQSPQFGPLSTLLEDTGVLS